MPVDVEQQLSALGKFWNETVAHVDATEIASQGPAHGSGSVNGVDVLTSARGRDRRPAIYQFTNEEATMIDLEHPPQTDEARRGPKRVVVAALATAAAVTAIALVAIRDDEPASPADQPSTTVTSPPTLPPRTLFGTLGEQLAPATYSIEKVEGAPTPQILVTIGEGWSTYDDWALNKSEEEGRVMSFSLPDRIFLDACDPSAGDHPGPLTTLDGLTTALTEQAGWINVTTPSDISIDGYAGKAFQRATPPDLSHCPGDFMSWTQTVYEPGSTNSVWVLDLAGTIIVVETRVAAGQPAEAHAEVAAMLDSIRIAPA